MKLILVILLAVIVVSMTGTAFAEILMFSGDLGHKKFQRQIYGLFDVADNGTATGQIYLHNNNVDTYLDVLSVNQTQNNRGDIIYSIITDTPTHPGNEREIKFRQFLNGTSVGHLILDFDVKRPITPGIIPIKHGQIANDLWNDSFPLWQVWGITGKQIFLTPDPEIKNDIKPRVEIQIYYSAPKGSTNTISLINADNNTIVSQIKDPANRGTFTDTFVMDYYNTGGNYYVEIVTGNPTIENKEFKSEIFTLNHYIGAS